MTSAPAAGGVFDGLEAAGALEWRADLLGDAGSSGFASSFDGTTIYTLRSTAEGGSGPDGGSERAQRLLAASAAFDLIDLEAERDLEPELLAGIPAERRILSWHGEAASAERLHGRFEAMAATGAHWYKLVPTASKAGDGLAPLALLRRLGRDDVIAFAAGRVGSWTRLVAPRLGAPVVFAQAGEVAAAPGQLTLTELERDYGLPELRPASHLLGIVGQPVGHSLSPRLHNRMYRELGMDRLFVAFEVPVFGDFWLDLVESPALPALGLELEGLAVTAPFKEIAMAVAGAVSPLAERLAAANTLVRRGAVWEAESTDPEGVIAPLEERGRRIQGRRAAVVGAGGAGRAAVFALSSRGAKTVLVNRGRERGRRVARQLGVDFLPLDGFDPRGFDLLVNATPAGASRLPSQLEPDRLSPEATLIDLAYRRGGPTELVRAVRASGRSVVDGREVLLHQAVSQFQAMTGGELDLELGRRALGLAGPGEATFR